MNSRNILARAVALCTVLTACAAGIETPAVSIPNSSTNADYVAGESSQVLVTPELRAVAGQMFGGNAEALLHAVSLQMGKYDLDMHKPEGRKAWHGRLVREEIHTNDLCKIEVYSNELTGVTWRFRAPFAPKPMVTASRRRTTYTTNGIPARLAAARARRAAQIDSGGETTNIVHTANSVNK